MTKISARILIGVAFCLTQVPPAAQAAQAGSVKAVITWQYNDYVGTKGDTEAKIVLLPYPPKKKIAVTDTLVIGEVGNAIETPDGRKYGIYVGRADGYGNAEIDDVRPGDYVALIISDKTTRDPSAPLEGPELKLLAPSFASNAALQKLVNPWLKINKSDVELVTVHPGETAHISHDFGNTFI